MCDEYLQIDDESGEADASVWSQMMENIYFI